MDDTAFHHTPISDQEVARRQRRLRTKRWLAFGLLVSAVITTVTSLKLLSWSPYAHMEASELAAPVLLGLFAVMVYVAVAGAGGFLWLCASFLFEDGVGPENESLRFDRLDVHQAQALRKLCDEHPPAQRIVRDWLAAGAILRVRDLRAIRDLVETTRVAETDRCNEAERSRIIESFKGPLASAAE